MKRSISVLRPEELDKLLNNEKAVTHADAPEAVIRTVEAFKAFGMEVPAKAASWIRKRATKKGYGRDYTHRNYTVPFPKYHREWFERWKDDDSDLTQDERDVISENVNIEDVLKGTPTQAQRALQDPIDIDEGQMKRIFRKTNHLTRVEFKMHPKHFKNFTWNVLLSLTDRQFVDTLYKLRLAGAPPGGEYPEAVVQGRLFTIVLKDEKRKSNVNEYKCLLEVLRSKERFRWYRILRDGYMRDDRDYLGSVQYLIYLGLHAAGHEVPKDVSKAFEQGTYRIDEDVVKAVSYLETHTPHPKTLEFLESGNFPILDRQKSVAPETTDQGPAAPPEKSGSETTGRPAPAGATAPVE